MQSQQNVRLATLSRSNLHRIERLSRVSDTMKPRRRPEAIVKVTSKASLGGCFFGVALYGSD